MDYNNIEDRIKRLYGTIGEKIVYPPESIMRHDLKEGKKTFSIEIKFGKSEMSDDEKSNFIQKSINIIHSLANLKDNLGKYFSNQQMVEDHINGSISLKIIVDLSNIEKHTYPLTGNKGRGRSHLQPRIENERKEIVPHVIIDGLFYDIMSINTFPEADITDINHCFIDSLSNIIKNALTSWEDLIIENLPAVSSKIEEGRIVAKQREDLFYFIQNMVNNVSKIINNGEWQDIDYKDLNNGDIVQYTTNGQIGSIQRAYCIGSLVNENNEDCILLYSDEMQFEITLVANQYRWKSIRNITVEDLNYLKNYFSTLPELLQKLTQ